MTQHAAVSVSVTTQLEQRLGATQIELRKLGSERHTLRARLRREADRLRELESALRAEKDLRAQAADEQFAAVLGLRSRLAEVEAERDAQVAEARSELEQARSQLQQLRPELERARAELERARAELEQTRSELEQARAELEQTRQRPAEAPGGAAAVARVSKVPQGLRRIRGIGPAYQRVLEQAGITRVQQIAIWTEADVADVADKLKIKPERISKDDWIGQAKALAPDPED
jgi:predicted flap endonuclease-1-like 5' DNA nuclease